MILSNASIAMISLVIFAVIVIYFKLRSEDEEAKNQKIKRKQKEIANRHKKLREMKNNR